VKLQESINLALPENDKETEGEILNTVLELLYKAKNPIILADACCIRHHVVQETHELLNKLQIPGFVTPMGKGALDETNSHYGGVYIGEISLPNVRSAVESSDCILSIGALLSDFNTVHPRAHSFVVFVGVLMSRGLLLTISVRLGPLNFIQPGLKYIHL
jgi:pyruvate decarboxylase